MTTPAVNLTQNQTITGLHFQEFDDGLGHVSRVDISSPITIWSRFNRVRPSSVSTPPVRGEPRAVTNWSHTRTHLLAHPADVFFTCPRTRAPGLSDQVSDYWEDGSFWNDLPVWSLPGAPSSLRSKAEIAALLKVQNQKVHMGNFVAQIRQTQDQFVGMAGAIASSVRRYRRSVSSRVWSLIQRVEGSARTRAHPNWRDIPSDWLALQYGWIPTMQDVFGLVNQLGEPEQKQIVSVKSQSSDHSEFKVVRSGQYGSSQVATFRVDWGCRVGLYYQIENPLIVSLSRLGLLNPSEIVWEVLPYSFVVDWALPIGNWLQSLTAAAGYSMIQGYRTERTKIARIDFQEHIHSPDGLPFSRKWTTGGGTGEITVSGDNFSMVRSKYLSSPVPGLYFKSPFSPGHVANAMSLLVQAFR